MKRRVREEFEVMVLRSQSATRIRLLRLTELAAVGLACYPCIIFIDEIDSLLSKNKREGSEGNSSRATINQLLWRPLPYCSSAILASLDFYRFNL